MKILFILKRREDYNSKEHNKVGLSTGLFNSATFMNDMLNDLNIPSNIEVAIDNNCIDKLVTKHKPTHVIIEALWVVPSKFTVLCRLHPNVKWIIRLHSEMPFLANEGIALDWIGDYANYNNVIIAANALRCLNEIRFYLGTKMNWNEETRNNKVIYLPNYYPQNYSYKEYNVGDTINICCFGAVRPMKNHLMQAIAAIKFANSINKKLNFHINSGRIEQKGETVIRNLEALFSHLNEHGHQLIAHEWKTREEFLNLCTKMDIGMQVSFSETFNIVGADIISQGVPLVGSKEIPWIDDYYSASANDTDEIFKALIKIHHSPELNVINNLNLLSIYTSESSNIWEKYFNNYERK
jgi:hypothetical protein